jgi:hypothetical protein
MMLLSLPKKNPPNPVAANTTVTRRDVDNQLRLAAVLRAKPLWLESERKLGQGKAS